MWAMRITGHSVSHWLPCPVPSWVPIPTQLGLALEVAIRPKWAKINAVDVVACHFVLDLVALVCCNVIVIPFSFPVVLDDCPFDEVCITKHIM